MARRTVTKYWFVSFEAPKQSRLESQFARLTKTFSTEAAAKQFAKEMLLSERKNIIAGTLLGEHQPERRIISGSELNRWIKQN